MSFHRIFQRFNDFISDIIIDILQETQEDQRLYRRISKPLQRNREIKRLAADILK